MMISLGFAIAGLIWGSFLNMLAYRLVAGVSLIRQRRSQCTSCHMVIAWYDLIPILSWILLGARCRFCKKTISWLYPLIEFLTALAFISVGYVRGDGTAVEIFFDLLFFSALMVAIRTDLQAMVIPRLVSLYLIPFGIAGSLLQATLALSPYDAALGAVVGFVSLWIINLFFRLLYKQDGIGRGDMELLAGIGSFLGILGVWSSVCIGSCIGSCIGVLYIWLAQKDRFARIPFGPFLAIGAWAHYLFFEVIVELFY